MKNILIGILALSITIVSCSKSSDKCTLTNIETTAPGAEVASVQNYLSANGIQAVGDPHGFFYKIIAPGAGTFVSNLCSKVSVNYVGKLTNGNIFDQSPAGTAPTFTLGQVIYGWVKGVPLIAKGGRILLFIPPSFGYGANPQRDGSGNIVIPANSILIFDITLVDIT